jgi:hypothetical protein
VRLYWALMQTPAPYAKSLAVYTNSLCNWDPAHMLSAILPKINLRLCIAYRTGQTDVVSAQMAIDAPKRTIPLDACLKDRLVLPQLISYMPISVFDGLIPGLLKTVLLSINRLPARRTPLLLTSAFCVQLAPRHFCRSAIVQIIDKNLLTAST